MPSYQHRVVIDRGIEEVFAFLMDAERNASWQPGVVTATQTTPGWAEVGSRVEEVRELLGYRFATCFEIVAIDPPRRCEVRSVDGPLSFRASYALAEHWRGTEVTFAGDVEACRLPGVGRASAMLARRQLAACADRLRDVLELELEEPAGVRW